VSYVYTGEKSGVIVRGKGRIFSFSDGALKEKSALSRAQEGR